MSAPIKMVALIPWDGWLLGQDEDGNLYRYVIKQSDTAVSGVTHDVFLGWATMSSALVA